MSEGRRQDLILGEEPAAQREAGQTDQTGHKQQEDRLGTLAHPAHQVDIVFMTGQVDDAAGAHEEQRLEEGVSQQMEHRRRDAADPDRHKHVTDLTHG